MDIEKFWSTVRFSPLYKDQGMWVMTAVVDSGARLQLNVVTKNRTPYLKDMDWKLIYGTEPKEITHIQHFPVYYDIENVLILKEEDRTKRVYRHRWDPIIITVQLDPDVVDMYVSENSCKLAEVISKPSFVIKRL